MKNKEKFLVHLNYKDAQVIYVTLESGDVNIIDVDDILNKDVAKAKRLLFAKFLEKEDAKRDDATMEDNEFYSLFGAIGESNIVFIDF